MFRRKFARQTVLDKWNLFSAVRHEIEVSAWFESGDYEQAKLALNRYVTRLESTENVVYVTVNSLSRETRSRSEAIGPKIIETLAPRWRAAGLPSNPAYLAHNSLLVDLFGYQITNMPLTNLSVADEVITQGLMNFAAQLLDPPPTERGIQTAIIALTLAAGWLESQERSSLTDFE